MLKACILLLSLAANSKFPNSIRCREGFRFFYLRTYLSANQRIATQLLSLLCLSTLAYSQPQPIDYKQQLNMPSILPNSPDVASIEKFGSIPTNYSTGVPDISIPIYTINCGNLSWPISLSYHSGGIRVDDVASSVGLGWSAIAPGVISRSKVGRHDEETNTEPNYTSVTDNDYMYLYTVLTGIADSELDVFSFNFNGRSGKFVIKQDGSVLQIPLSNLKITYVVGGNTAGLASFTITDENGIVYLFAQQEFTTESRVSSVDPITEYFVSSWYLTKIEMPDTNNAIQFSYAGAGPSFSVLTTFIQAVGEKYAFHEESNQVYPHMFNQSSLSKVFVKTDMVKLTGITFPNGTILYTYDAVARKDVGSGNDATNKLSTITVNQIGNGISVPLKQLNFYQSYFNYRPPDETLDKTTQYRLRLDSLAEYGIIGASSPKKYKFEYNMTPMVPRENNGQDLWGFNNGKYNNPTLLQSDYISFNNGSKTMSFAIGDADRSIDVNKMQACILTSITYPTGGKTTFTFEPHVYNADQNLTSKSEYVAQALGNQPTPQVSTATFTFPPSAVPIDARIIVDMSKYDFPGVTQPSWVSVMNLTTGVIVYTKTQTTPYQAFSSNDPISLVKGNSYEIRAYVYSNITNSQLSARIKVQWENYTNTPDVRIGGGLRIKEIKNYSTSGLLAGTETYVYDTAVTLTPFANIQKTYSEVIYRLGTQCSECSFCQYVYSNTCRVYHSSSIYALSTAMGSPMLYRRVQKFTTDSGTGATNGMSEYRYDVFRDETYSVGGRYTYVPLLSNDWMNGSLVSETHYKVSGGIYSKVKTKEYKYSQFNTAQAYSLRVQYKEIHEGCSLVFPSISSYAEYYSFPTRTGSKRLREEIEMVYDDNNNKIETHTSYDYQSNQYDFPTKTILVDSKDKSDSIILKRSPDFSATGNVYEKMVQRNIIAPVIEQKSYSDDILLSTVKNNYRDWNSDGKVIALDSVQASTLTNALETRLRYFGFDTYNNPLSVGKVGDVKRSYLWDYASQYPVAEVTNAEQADIAYTSFEADGKGSWIFSGSPVTDAFAPTGKRAYNLANGSINRTISSAKTYVLSCWARVQPTVANATLQVTGRSLNGYTYYEYKTNVAVTSVQISGSGLMDELRLYPSTAQMTTYAYTPLVGITAQCDVNNRITYFQYDNFNRLFVVRDQDQNIIKKICYNYQGQPETCTLYGNDVQSQSFNKQCPSEQNGSSVSYTVPENTYQAFSKAEANALALADINQNGQSYANQHGTCTAAPCSFTIASGFSMGSSNITSSGNSVSFYLVFYANSGTSPNWSGGVQVATITGCRPSVGRLFSMATGGRTWEVMVTTTGEFKVRLTSGQPPCSGSSGPCIVALTSGSYNL